MLSLIAASALASPLSDVAELAGGEGTSFVMSCGPLGETLGGTDELLAELRKTEGEKPWFALLDPTRASAAGIGLDRNLRVSIDGRAKNGVIQVPFAGDRAQAQAALELLGPVTAQGDGWNLADKAAARLADGWLTVSFSGGETGPGAPTPVLDDLGTTSGCALWLRTRRPLGKAPPIEVGASLATGQGELQLYQLLVEGKPAPELLEGRGKALKVRTHQVPMAVISAGFSLKELLAVPAISAKVAQDGLDLTQFEDLNVAPGTMFALFASDDIRKPEFAAVLPIRGPLGLPVSAGRLARAVLKAEPDARKVSRTSLVLPGDKPTYLGTRRGRIWVATQPALAADLAEGGGELWMDRDMRSFARDWPVATRMDLGPTMSQALGVDVGPMLVRSGLGSNGPTWRLGLVADFDRERLQAAAEQLQGSGVTSSLASRAALLRAMTGASARGASASPFGEMGFPEEVPPATPDQPTREVEATATVLWIRQRAVMDETGAPELCQAAPRPLSQLTPQAVPWTPDECWTRLGWVPEGPVMGAYWFEDDGGSFRVLGAVDADGDGVPAIYAVESSGNSRWTTPDDVR